MEKYQLTDDCIKYGCRELYRITALKNFSNVKAGVLGGYVESEKNLSHDGDCWIYDNAKVFNNALVKDNAKVYNNAIVCDDAIVYGNAKIYGNANVYDNGEISFGEIFYDLNKPVKSYKDVHYIYASLGIYPTRGNYILYRAVKRLTDGFYSELNDYILYYDNKDIKGVEACGFTIPSKLYVTDEAVISAIINIDDIVAFENGMVKAKSVYVIGEIKEFIKH